MSTAVGQANPFSDASEFNTLDFIIARATDEMQTVSIGQVTAVNTGAQTVDVQILVNLVTGANTPVVHEVIAGRPYFRLQGGGNAIICDPVVGDIGVVVFASRDITGVVAAKGAANPSSNRRFSWSDGIYFGGILNGTPTQYIQFAAAGGGINIVSPGTVAIQAPATTISGTANVAGNTTLQATLAVTGTSTLTGAVAAPGGITTTTIAGASAVFSGSVTASSFIGGGGGGGSVTSVNISTGGVGVVVGGGPITTAGTLTVDLSSTAYAALALAVTALQTVSVQDSISGAGTSGSKLQLVNDSATPGANMVYGTDGSGTKGWQAAGGGSAEPFNVTPDTHGTIPTGVGLGPNDEHESGSTIDTAGTRYAGATAWSWLNQSTTVSTIAAGSNIFSVIADGTNHAVIQPAPATPWEITAKVAIGGPGSGLGTGPGLIVVHSGGAQYVFLNETANGPFACYKFNNPTSFNSTLFNNTSLSLGQPLTAQWVYMRIQNDGTNLHFLASPTGIPGSYQLFASDALSSFIGSVTDYGEVFNNNVVGGIGAFDYFRRTA